MKNGIVNIWLLGLIVVFIAIFSAYIIININYSKSFKIKNEVLTIIEKHKGVTKSVSPGTHDGTSLINGSAIKINVNTIETINLYLMGNNYDAMGYCPHTAGDISGNWYGVSELRSGSGPASEFEPADSSKKYYYCFAKYNANTQTGRYKAVYYKVRLFYKFEVPVLEEFLSVKVDGTSDEIYDPQDEGEGITAEDYVS